MKIPFIDLQAQYQLYKNEIDTAIHNVLDSSQFIMGPSVDELEDNLAKFVDSKHAIACSSGTDALLLALMALGIKAGDEVITSPFSFIATAEVISLLGAVPIFVDIEEDTYNIDATKIESKITSRTKAIMPVSLYGQTADMDAINHIAKKHHLKVIEDAAQSFGAEYKGKMSCNLSNIGCTSFFPSKPLGCYGDGGALFTNNDDIADKVRLYLAHGSKRRYDHEVIGINGRLDAIQAAVLNVKLKYFKKEIELRNKVAEFYLSSLSSDDYKLPVIKDKRTSVYAQFTLQSDKREALINKLNNIGIPIAIHYPKPLHLQTCFLNLGYKLGDFPIAEKAANEVFSLPMSPYLGKDHQSYIIKNLQSDE